MSIDSRATQKALLLLSALIVLALIYIASSAGLRGTDQYQYIADAETVRKNQQPLTNLFFPAKIVRNQQVQQATNYFSHNGPLLHIVAKVTTLFDVHSSWIFLNCIFHLITATVIFLLARTHTNSLIATAVTALYLSSPIAMWQASNALQEQFFGALIALCLLCYYRKRNNFALMALPLLYCIGAMSHPIFILTGLLHGGFLILASLANRKIKLAFAGMAVISLIAFAMALAGEWFPTQFQPSLKEIITSAIPNYSNMVYHFQETLPDLDGQLLQIKLIAAIKMQFFSVKNAPFFIYTNIAAFGLIFLLLSSIFRKSIAMELIAPLAVLFGAYVGIVVLQQNHARFQQIVSPATFIIIAFVFQRLKLNTIKPVVLIVCFSLIFDTVLVRHMRLHANRQVNSINELKTNLQQLTDNSKLLSIDIREHGALAYALRPNSVLTVNTTLMKKKSIVTASDLFQPDYVLMKGEHEDLLPSDSKFVIDIDNEHFGQLKLFSY